MAWRDTLQGLRDELAEIRAQRQTAWQVDEDERQGQRDELSRLAESLGIEGLLQEMNTILLADRGKVEKSLSWEEDEEDEPLLMPEDLEDLDDTEYVSSVLIWEEGGEREIAVDLGFGEQGTSLLVNGADIRPEQEALEQALVEAFREQLEL